MGQEKSGGANPVQLNQPKKQQQESHVEENSEGQHPSNPYPTKKENPNLQKKTTEPTTKERSATSSGLEHKFRKRKDRVKTANNRVETIGRIQQ